MSQSRQELYSPAFALNDFSVAYRAVCSGDRFTLAQAPPGKLWVCTQCLDMPWNVNGLGTEVQDHPGGGHLEKEVTATTLDKPSCDAGRVWQIHSCGQGAPLDVFGMITTPDLPASKASRPENTSTSLTALSTCWEEPVQGLGFRVYSPAWMGAGGDTPQLLMGQQGGRSTVGLALLPTVPRRVLEAVWAHYQ